jgi:APA family basic amino acid/polyamine antiporter
MVFRKKLPDAPRPVPVPGYPWVPVLFSLAGAGIVFNTFFTDTWNALMGTAIMALGVPVFLLWRLIGRRDVV